LWRPNSARLRCGALYPAAAPSCEAMASTDLAIHILELEFPGGMQKQRRQRGASCEFCSGCGYRMHPEAPVLGLQIGAHFLDVGFRQLPVDIHDDLAGSVCCRSSMIFSRRRSGQSGRPGGTAFISLRITTRASAIVATSGTAVPFGGFAARSETGASRARRLQTRGMAPTLNRNEL
jgi:hypothetical protein